MTPQCRRISALGQMALAFPCGSQRVTHHEMHCMGENRTFQINFGFLGKRLHQLKSPSLRPPQFHRDQHFFWKHGITVHLVRQPRARRYLLRLRAKNEARLVIPRGGSQAEALHFLERSEGWLLEQISKWESRVDKSWTVGTSFLFRGEEVVLRLENDENGICLCFSDQKILLPDSVGDYRPLVQKHLRCLAVRELYDRTWELARIHGITIDRVTIRAQTTRWGSCSIRGTISLNWRLIQAPPHVSDYLIIHELMHRREMNHSVRFWKLVADACPDYRLAEQWLKKIHLEHT